jgi:hypothetical protein
MAGKGFYTLESNWRLRPVYFTLLFFTLARLSYLYASCIIDNIYIKAAWSECVCKLKSLLMIYAAWYTRAVQFWTIYQLRFAKGLLLYSTVASSHRYGSLYRKVVMNQCREHVTVYLIHSITLGAILEKNFEHWPSEGPFHLSGMFQNP